MVESLTKVVKDLSKHACEDTQDAVANSKINMDAIDEADQKSLLGSLIITVPNKDLQKEIGIADGKAYDDLNITALTNAIGSRYKMDFRPSDLTFAKRITRSGAIKITFADTKAGSKFATLVRNMKAKGANKGGENLYANFALTHRRNNMLFTLREAWKNKKIDKYYSDYDGSISVVPTGSSKKIKITNVANKDSDCIPWTMTKGDLEHNIRNGFADFRQL